MMQENNTNTYIIKNGKIFFNSSHFISADLLIENGIIKTISDKIINPSASNIIDVNGDMIIPGLIDTHLHGCNGFDLSDASFTAIDEICKFELSRGITTICPATMTLPESELLDICQISCQYLNALSSNSIKPTDKASFIGIYMEGPFFSSEKAGAQRKDCLSLPSINLYHHLMKASQNIIKIWALAPELNDCNIFLETVIDSSAFVPIFSIGHTICDKQTAADAFSLGCKRITHLYNGMKNPYDIMEAAIPYKDCYAELICDGIHNSRERILQAFQMFGDERIILISDSMRATGLSDGIYTLGGQEVFVQGKEALLHSGNKAGSVSTLYDCFCTAVSLGIPLESAIKSVTSNPAKSLGLEKQIGSIRQGMRADLLIINSELQLKSIIKNGFIN